MAAIEALKEETVIVFIDGLQFYETPEVVQKAMTSGPALGSPLPIVGIFDAALQTELGVVGYSTMEDKDGFTAVKEALAEDRSEKADAKKQTQRQLEMWKDSRGRTMHATYVKSTAEEVTFRLKNGQQSTLKLSLLSDASQKRVAQLAER